MVCGREHKKPGGSNKLTGFIERLYSQDGSPMSSRFIFWMKNYSKTILYPRNIVSRILQWKSIKWTTQEEEWLKHSSPTKKNIKNIIFKLARYTYIFTLKYWVAILNDYEKT